MRPSAVFLAVLAALTGPLTAGSLQFKLDPAASSLTFAARVNIGIDSFTGTVDAWTLDLTMPAGGDLPEHAVFTANVAAMKTGKDKRDDTMREWLEDAKFATIRYEMKTIRKTATGIEADGELTIHGKTLPLTMPITIERKDAALTVRGEVTLDYRTFDLTVVRMAGFVTVKPEVKIAFVASGTLE